MTGEYSRASYYLIAVIGIVGFIQGIATPGNRSPSRDRDSTQHPLIAWPSWFQRTFYMCVGVAVFFFALWKLWRG
jgi:hypothetical protein